MKNFILFSIIIAVIAVIAIFISKIAKLFLRKIDKYENKIYENKNPYIQAHKFKNSNDELYNEYLIWLDKNGGDIPFEKYVYLPDKKFDSEIDKLIN
jgi:hypothetical protein